MSSRLDTLTAIMAAFSGRDQLVERAFRENRSFRCVCQDYVRCAAALDHWQQVATPKAGPRRRVYGGLLQELGGEIEDWLDRMDKGPPRSSEGPP